MSRHLFATAASAIAFSCVPATLEGITPWLIAIGSLAAASAQSGPKAAIGGFALGAGIAFGVADFLVFLP